MRCPLQLSREPLCQSLLSLNASQPCQAEAQIRLLISPMICSTGQQRSMQTVSTAARQGAHGHMALPQRAQHAQQAGCQPAPICRHAASSRPPEGAGSPPSGRPSPWLLWLSAAHLDDIGSPTQCKCLNALTPPQKEGGSHSRAAPAWLPARSRPAPWPPACASPAPHKQAFSLAQAPHPKQAFSSAQSPAVCSLWLPALC